MQQRKATRSLRISVIYASVTAIWIIFSDRLLSLLTHNLEQQSMLQTGKGLFFILSTAGLIYFLLARELRLQEQVLDKLEQSEARWRSVVENAPDIILTVNLQGEILFINQMLEGVSELETLDTPIFDFIPPKYHIVVCETLKHVFETGQPTSYEFEALGPHGFSGWYIMRLAPIKHAQRVDAVILIAHDISDRKRAEEALREREERFRLAMEHIPDVVVIYDPTLTIQFINTATTRLTGRPVSDFIGRQEEEIWSPEVYETYLPTLQEALATKTTCTIELDLTLPDGALRALAITCVPVLNEKGEVREILGITHDFTERRRTQQAEHEQRILAEALADTATVLTSTLNLDYVMDRILANVGRVVPHDTAYIMLIEAGVASVARCWGFAEFGAEETMSALTVPVADLSDLQWMADHAQPLVIPNTRTCAEWVDLPETHWASSFAGAPLIREERVIGFLGLLSRHPDFFNAIHAERLQAFADQAGIALYNAQLFTEEHTQRTLAQALRDTARALISAVDFDAVMNTILENVARVVPHDAANIMLIEGDLARPIYWRGYPAEYTPFIQGFRISISATPNLHQMVEKDTPFLVPHTDHYPDWISQPLTEWVKSYVAAPIRSHGQVIGFLNLDSGTPDFFNEQHVQRLQSFADQASIAIEHAQLYDEIHRHSTELEQRVTERTAQLDNTLHRIEAILNSSDDIIILCHTDGTIQQVNPAFDKTFVCEPDEMLFQPLADLVTAEHAPLFKQTFQEVTHTFHPRRLEITIRCEGRNAFEADVVLSPIIEQSGHISGVVCSLRDITERKQLETQLRQMLEHEMELVELKSRYMAMAAHDLRNPLAVIQTTTDLLHKYGNQLSGEAIEKRYGRIQNSINVMVALLDDILTLGQAESGKLSFQPAPLELVAFCKTIVAETQQIAGESPPIYLNIHGNCDYSALDAKLLRHILGNLLSNATKYSPADRPVTFIVQCEADHIIFQVGDQGMGIPKDEQQHLFETFFRASNAKRIPGTGLGLAIVKQSVELHGGTILFESKQGHGTTFTVIIPHRPGENRDDHLEDRK